MKCLLYLHKFCIHDPYFGRTKILKDLLGLQIWSKLSEGAQHLTHTQREMCMKTGEKPLRAIDSSYWIGRGLWKQLVLLLTLATMMLLSETVRT